MGLRCRIGIHRWTRIKIWTQIGTWEDGTQIYAVSHRCQRCKIVKNIEFVDVNDDRSPEAISDPVVQFDLTEY